MEAETSHLKDITDLYKLCKNVPLQPKSNFDPMSKVSNEIKTLLQNLSIIYNKHNYIYSKLIEDSQTKLHGLFSDDEFLSAYKSLFTHCINLIFHVATNMFREEQSPNFLNLTLSLYQFIKDLSTQSRDITLSKVAIFFEHKFNESYSNLNLSAYKGNSVKNLLSFLPTTIIYPNLDPANIIDSHYFRLTCGKFNYKKELVELVELSNGDFLFYNLESGTMARIFDNGKTTLLEFLSKGNYNLLDVNKKVMFAPLKASDMSIVQYSNNGVVLETRIGNGVILELTSENVFHWESNWKNKIQSSFDNLSSKTSFTSIKQIPTFKNSIKTVTSLKRSEDVFKFDSFLLNNSSLSKSVSPYKEDEDTIPNTNLYRSDSLLNPINILPQKNLNNDRNETPGSLTGERPDIMTQKNLPSDGSFPAVRTETMSSFNDIESLSIERLMELNENIDIELSPVRESPIKSNIVRSVSQTFLVRDSASITSKYGKDATFNNNIHESSTALLIDHDELDDESIISEEEVESMASMFNPNIEFYKPSKLKKKRSNSVLSLFSNRNKRSLTLNTSKNSSSASVFELNTPDTPLFPQEPKTLTKTSVVGPTKKQLEQSNIVFEDNNVNLSNWNGNSWVNLGKNKQHIAIYLLQNNKIMFCAYDDIEKNQAFLLSHITSKWNILKTTAQDIQIHFPQKDCLDHILKLQNQYTITIRSNKTNELFNILQNCIGGEIHKRIRKSNTLTTLSTSSSSNISNSIFSNSGSLASSLTIEHMNMNKMRYHLLIPNIKIRYYILDQDKKWSFKGIATINVYLQEHENVKTGVKFEYQPDNLNSLGSFEPSIFICPLNSVKKLRDTGLVINCDESFKLFEFTSRTITEQVFKLIHSLF